MIRFRQQKAKKVKFYRKKSLAFRSFPIFQILIFFLQNVPECTHDLNKERKRLKLPLLMLLLTGFLYSVNQDDSLQSSEEHLKVLMSSAYLLTFLT